MGLHLRAKVNPKYWDSIKAFGEEYRQFDGITFVNTTTGKEKTFSVAAVSTLDAGERIVLERLTPDISWNADKDIYRIELGSQSKKPKSE